MSSIDPRWPKVLSLSVHEFRTPLTVVSGYIRMLLKDRALSDHQRELLQRTEGSCARMSAILVEISDLSALEAGTAKMDKRQVELQAVLRSAADQLPPLPDGREVEIHLELSAPPFSINGDAVRLTQALGSVAAALRRELIGAHGLTIRDRESGSGYELLMGDPDTIAALETESDVERQVFDEWRGGVGLSLPVARRVLNAHGAELHGAPGGAKAGARILFRSA